MSDIVIWPFLDIQIVPEWTYPPIANDEELAYEWATREEIIDDELTE